MRTLRRASDGSFERFDAPKDSRGVPRDTILERHMDATQNAGHAAIFEPLQGLL